MSNAFEFPEAPAFSSPSSSPSSSSVDFSDSAEIEESPPETKTQIKISYISPEDQFEVAESLQRFEILRRTKHFGVQSYPPMYRYPVICFAMKESNSEQESSALFDDIETVQDLSWHLKLHFKVHVRMLIYDRQNQYDGSFCDVLISTFADFDPTLVMNAKLSLVRIAWIRDNFLVLYIH